MIRVFLTTAVLLSMLGTARAETPAKDLFGAMSTASEHQPYALGSYAKGCLAGAQQLPESGPRWQAMRLSRNRNWGHPDMIAYIDRLSRQAVRAGWKGIYVGDISQPRGGPMLTGHASHQLGLDADIWMLPAMRLNLSRGEREELSSINVRSADGKSVNGNWTRAHHQILRAAASDPDIARIFVTPPVKIRMCADERGNRDYLRKIRPWSGHNFHFHVRLNCPDGVAGCTEQAAPPPGDGCEEAKTWLLPAPPPDPNAPRPKPRPPLTLADLPQQCAAVLAN